MKSLEPLRCFIKVVEEGSFSAAAQKLNIAVSSVSRYVQLLENDLNIILFTRNTRLVKLTDIGKVIYQQAVDIQFKINNLGQLVSEREDHVRGKVKITAPLWFGSHLITPIFMDLKNKWPELLIQVDYNDSVRDPYNEEDDLFVQISNPKNSSFIARPLKVIEYWLCASSEYINKYGCLLNISDLNSHKILKQSAPTGYDGWYFYELNGNCIHFDTSDAWFLSNTSWSLWQAALNHSGIVMLARNMVESDVNEGKLIRLLEKYHCTPYPKESSLHLVYTKDKVQDPKCRVVIDSIVNNLGFYSNI